MRLKEADTRRLSSDQHPIASVIEVGREIEVRRRKVKSNAELIQTILTMSGFDARSNCEVRSEIEVKREVGVQRLLGG